MKNIEEIEKEIEKYQKGENKKHWQNKNIDITIKGKETSFSVNGFGICENNNFSIESYRYYLEFEINGIKNDKVLTVLLMNPSDKTDPNKNNIDNTIKNALKIAYALEYSKVKIFNSFAKICGNGDEAKKYYKNKNKDIENVNKGFVKNHLEKTGEILLACGDGVTATLYQDYLNILNGFEKKLWTYAETLTTKNRPRHLSIQSQINRELFEKFIDSKEKHFIKILEKPKKNKKTTELFVKIIND